MKRIWIVAMALFAFSQAGLAQSDSRKGSVVRKISVAPFNGIEAMADIHVLLLDTDKPGEVYLEGDSSYFDDLRIEVIEGSLRISPKTSGSLRKKFIVQVPVAGLTRITATNKANIISLNTLQTDGIQIRLDERSSVALQSTGPVSVSASRKH